MDLHDTLLLFQLPKAPSTPRKFTWSFQGTIPLRSLSLNYNAFTCNILDYIISFAFLF